MCKKNVYAYMKSKKYQLKAGTKNVWLLVEDEGEKAITKQEYHNITDKDTLKWFRNLGGSEYASKGYTSKGYKITELISKSPDRTFKHVRSFNLNVDYRGNKL